MPVVIILTICAALIFNYKNNPIWRNQQLKRLEVGEVRWIMSPKKGDGHVIAVVKKIDAKEITYDRYHMENGQYILDFADGVYKIRDFFWFTYPEPVFFQQN